MADSLRLGGPEMGGVAQTGFNQTREQLRVTADRKYWNGTPLSVAYARDKELIEQESATLEPRVQSWQDALSGLSYPGGFKTDVDFYWPPGKSDDGPTYFGRVGYSTWLARDAADHAAIEAAAAEEAAKDAQKYAESAQQAAEQAEKEANAEQIETGTVVDETGVPIGDMFYVVDHVEKVGDPRVVRKSDGCDGWIDKLFYNGDCTITTRIGFKAVLDLYLCTAQDLDLSQFTCPSGATVYLGEYPTKELSTEVTHTITIAEYQEGIDPVDILFGSWIKCAQKITPGGSNGSWGGCAWAAVDVASLFAGKILRPIANAVKAVDAAARTGIGFTGAYKALRALGLAEDVVLRIGVRGLDGFVKTCARATLRLSAAVAAGSGCEGIIGYASTELSRMAYKARTAAGFPAGKNLAVARVPGWNDPKTGDLVVGFSKGNGYHSENHILDQLAGRNVSPTKITELYSERQPCSACGPLLEDALTPGTPINWSVPWGDDVMLKKSANEILKEMIKNAGGV